MPNCSLGLFPEITPGLRGALARRWSALSRRLNASDGPAQAWFDGIMRAYAEPHRHYHTIAHVAQVLAALDALPPAREPDEVKLAAWFHDLVVDPTRDDNEERSAQAAGRALGEMGLAPPRVDRIQQLVRATALHEAGADRDAALLIDADLAPLAVDWGAFQVNSKAIRREFAHLSDADYRKGRAAFLRSLLGRGRLFQTEAMRAACEAPARANLASSLRSLQGEANA
jgi:predicted metal-dependent HD superfamily phosphohydrolase